MTRRARQVVPALLVCIAALESAAAAQVPPIDGYLQIVPVVTAPTPLVPRTAAAVSRLRISSAPALGAATLDVAYEHVVTLGAAGIRSRLGVGRVPGGGEWLALQWDAAARDRVAWRHRFDRLSVLWRPAPAVDVRAGRQAVSWGTTLFLTPADPFLPFNPADPFREFRAGIDAARVTWSPSPLSAVEVVVRPTRARGATHWTALARALGTVSHWEVSGWGGTLYGEPAAAVAAAGSFGPWAVRGEAAVRALGDGLIVRSAVGTDRLFRVAGRDLALVAEYQRDGLGGTNAEDYLEILRSETFGRGERQVLGRDTGVLQLSYQLHPLWTVSGLGLVNLNDRSALASPSVSFSAGDEATIAGGVYLAAGGDRAIRDRPLPTEYGATGTTLYVSLSWYF